MIAGRWIVAVLGIAAALTFALVAARCIRVLVITPTHFRAASVIFAIVAAWLAYKGMQAATTAASDAESVARGLLGGIAGAFVGALSVLAAFAMFGQTARIQIAHSLGLHGVDVSMFRLLVAMVLLGFGAGFVLRIPKLRTRRE